MTKQFLWNIYFEIFDSQTPASSSWFHPVDFLYHSLATSILICSDCHNISELLIWDSDLMFWRLVCLQAFQVHNLDSELLI